MVFSYQHSCVTLGIAYHARMKLIAKFIITALAILLVAQVVPGIYVENFYSALIAALVLGVLNIFVRPILIILTLPVTILTLGLFIFVINAFLFLFAASFIDGFEAESFIAALFGSLIVSVISLLANNFLK